MATWSRLETLKLIEIWSDESIQEQLEGCTHNKHIFQKISKKLEEVCYNKSLSQCREKIKKLKQEYRKLKDKLNKTGEEGKRFLIAGWEFYEPLNAILGNRPSTEPTVVIDSASDINTMRRSSESREDEEFTDTEVDGTADVVCGDGQGMSSSKSDCGSESSNSCSDVKPKLFSTKKKPQKRKRQIDIVQDTLKEVVQQLMDVQKESDKKFVRLEEKRLKMEEAQLERERIMRKEDHEFQLQMMQMLTSANYPPPFSFKTPASYYHNNSE